MNLLQERNQLSIQLTNLQVDFDNINARLEEETENASSLRSQLQKAVADYQNLKSRFDKELLAKTEELEDLRRVHISYVSHFKHRLM